MDNNIIDNRSGLVGSGIGGVVSKQISETDREFGILEVRIKCLNQHIVELAEKLKPIMRDTDQLTPEGVDEKPTGTAIGGRIYRNRKDIEMSIDAVVHIKNVLEI